MANYMMTIAYDGTRYKGWQSQKLEEKTIQGKIEAVLEKMTGRAVEIHGSGRTDAGVHALAQTANFKLPDEAGKFTEEQILKYLNEYLPEDIAVTSIKTVSDRFHARLSASRKTYRYRIYNSSIPCVFERKYVWSNPEKLDVKRMQEAADYLIGTHDFQTFCASKMKKSSIRTIYSLEVEKNGEEIDITVCGNGFLHHMVRIIVGTLTEVGNGKTDPWEIKKMLESKVRSNAGILAPACGLALIEVMYN